MPFNFDEISYKHSIIQFSESLLNKFIIQPQENYRTSCETLVYGAIFAFNLGKNSEIVSKILMLSKASRDELLNDLVTELLNMISNKNIEFDSEYKKKIKDYFLKSYNGVISDGSARRMIGDLFLVSLAETLVDWKNSNRLLDKGVLEQLMNNKEQDWAVKIISNFSEGGEFILKGEDYSSPEVESFHKMGMAFSQFLEFRKMIDFAEGEENSKLDYDNSLISHLKYMKEISQDTYRFIETNISPLQPSDEVLKSFFFISSFLLKTHYEKSVSINREYSAKFFQIIGEETPYIRMIDDKVKEKVKELLNPPSEPSKSITKFFNPFRIFSDRIGFISTWVIWIVTVLAVLILVWSHAMSPLFVSGFLETFGIFLQSDWVLGFLLFYLFSSSIILIVNLILISRKIGIVNK
ncbi:MAG: hypothetical protein QXU18_14465 [Thermoplasmatales archaeon]